MEVASDPFHACARFNRLEWNSITIIMISRPISHGEYAGAVSSFAIEMAVRCACDIRGISSLKEKQVYRGDHGANERT